MNEQSLGQISGLLADLFSPPDPTKEDALILPLEWLDATRCSNLTAFLSTMIYPHWRLIDGKHKLLLSAFESTHWWDERKAKVFSFRNADSRARRKWARKLEGLGLITLEKPCAFDIRDRLLEAKIPQALNLDNTKQCQWCKCQTKVINQHHFPIPKSEGGGDVVEICPNCRFEYHALEDDIYIRLTAKLQELSNAIVVSDRGVA